MLAFQSSSQLRADASTCTACVSDSPAQRRMTKHMLCAYVWPASTCCQCLLVTVLAQLCTRLQGGFQEWWL